MQSPVLSPPPSPPVVVVPAVLYTREQVSLHSKREDCWIIISGKVYDVTKWLDKHPGGRNVLQHYGGQDATIVFHAFHRNMKKVHSYKNVYYIGELVEEEREMSALSQDFMKLKHQLMGEGIFKPDPNIFWLNFPIIVLLEAVGVALLYLYGPSWLPWLTATVLVAISQGHAIHLVHEAGHQTLFKSRLANQMAQALCIGVIKGHSSSWWNNHHFQHHAKTNVYIKDPYITTPLQFSVVGTLLPKKWGQERKGYLPYQYQDKYQIVVPPLLVLVLYNAETIVHMIVRRKWTDFLLILIFGLRWYFVYSNLLGGAWSAVMFYLAVKILFSTWWTLVSQTNHFPMEVEPEDTANDWVTLQVSGTCNVESSWFLDWFMVRLNFQIEHHLFPTMPCYKGYLAQPHVQALCQKYNIDYQVKPFFQAFKDIFKSLKKSGEIWWQEYQTAATKKEN